MARLRVRTEDLYTYDEYTGYADTSGPGGQERYISHAVVKCAECITSRHLLSQIVSNTIAALRTWSDTPTSDSNNNGNPHGPSEDDWANVLSQSRCEHISLLAGVLTQALELARCEKFVLVLDGVDALREGGQLLLAGLARVGELVCLTMLFCSKLWSLR